MKSSASIRQKDNFDQSTQKCVEGKVGSNIYLEVGTDARINVDRWTFNGERVKTELYSTYGLSLQNAEFSQSGKYECILRSGAIHTFDVKVYDYMFGDRCLGIRTYFPGIGIREKPRGYRAKTSSHPSISKCKPQTDSYKNGKIDEYSMERNPRGIACIVVIDQFDFLPPLDEIKYDIDNCKQTFEHLQFDVRICDYKKAKDILKFIENIANEDHSKYDCSVLYFSSHGGDGFVCGKDFVTEDLRKQKCDNEKKTNFPQSTEIFIGENNSDDKLPKGFILFDTMLDLFVSSKTLLSKPKLFFFDSCRLPNKDIATPTLEAPLRPFSSPEQMQEQYTDILIGHASLLGRSAFLSTSGSAYTEILTNCLNKFSATESVADVMNEVNVRMRKNKIGNQQFSTHNSYLEKKLVMRREMQRNFEKEMDKQSKQLIQTEEAMGIVKQEIKELEAHNKRLTKKLKEEEIERQIEREKHIHVKEHLQNTIRCFELETKEQQKGRYLAEEKLQDYEKKSEDERAQIAMAVGKLEIEIRNNVIEKDKCVCM